MREIIELAPPDKKTTESFGNVLMSYTAFSFHDDEDHHESFARLSTYISAKYKEEGMLCSIDIPEMLPDEQYDLYIYGAKLNFKNDIKIGEEWSNKKMILNLTTIDGIVWAEIIKEDDENNMKFLGNAIICDDCRLEVQYLDNLDRGVKPVVYMSNITDGMVGYIDLPEISTFNRYTLYINGNKVTFKDPYIVMNRDWSEKRLFLKLKYLNDSLYAEVLMPTGTGATNTGVNSTECNFNVNKYEPFPEMKKEIEKRANELIRNINRNIGE